MIWYKYGTEPSTDQKLIDFIGDHNSGTIFHEPEFNLIVSKHFQTNFYYLLLFTGDEIKGICPLHQKGKKFYSAPRHFDVVYGGLLLKEKNDYGRVLKTLGFRAYQSLLEYWTFPDVNEELDPSCFRSEAQTAIIDLGMDFDHIFQHIISSKRRNMIRKAQKNNVRIDTGGSEIFDRFFSMLQNTYARTGLNTRPELFYREILDYYFPNRKAVCMIASQEDRDLSGIIIVRNQVFSSYWLGVSSGEKLNLGASELLQAEAIQWSMANKSRYYDLCVIDKERLPNIARFKSGFSDRMVPFYFMNKKPLLYRILNKLQIK